TPPDNSGRPAAFEQFQYRACSSLNVRSALRKGRLDAIPVGGPTKRRVQRAWECRHESDALGGGFESQTLEESRRGGLARRLVCLERNRSERHDREHCDKCPSPLGFGPVLGD